MFCQRLSKRLQPKQTGKSLVIPDLNPSHPSSCSPPEALSHLIFQNSSATTYPSSLWASAHKLPMAGMVFSPSHCRNLLPHPPSSPSALSSTEPSKTCQALRLAPPLILSQFSALSSQHKPATAWMGGSETCKAQGVCSRPPPTHTHTKILIVPLSCY